MTVFTRPLAKTLPYARSLTVAALMAASFVATPLMAQTAPQAKPPAAAAATSNKPETLDQRITDLHATLQITPAEEGKWAPVADAMRSNAAAMDKLVMSHKAKDPAAMTAVDDLATYQTFAQAQADGLKTLTTAFESLYDSMPDTQKKVADAAFQKYGR
jgi:hypothetical protein